MRFRFELPGAAKDQHGLAKKSEARDQRGLAKKSEAKEGQGSDE